jgi:mono/diheme cytochrome c family protein
MNGNRPMSASRRKKWAHCFSIVVLSSLLLMWRSEAADPVLDVVIGGDTRHFARDALLARPDVANVEVAADVAYGKAMRFRAVPVAALLAGLNPPADSVIETVALDGFAAQLPLDLITNTDPAKPVAWLAIEPADNPWPPLPGKTASAGPFYILWTGAAAATIRSEQWPYQVAKLASQPSPASRWPALGVDPALPATHPVRAGQALFVTQCLPCHNLNGAGASAIGPDLNKPMSPTEYLTRAGLRALIRDPKSVRSWAEQRMPGFAADQMSDREIDLVIDYFTHMAARRTSP